MNYETLKNNINIKFQYFIIPIKTKLASIYKFLYEKYDYNLNLLKNSREKLKDLKAANFALGMFHLQNGNLNDAIFRFIFIDKILSPNNAESKLMLGWCYLMKGNIQKALRYLHASSSPEAVSLINYLEESNLEKIPSSILIQYYETWADKIEKEFLKREEVLNSFLEFLGTTLNEFTSNPKILEIGCKTGLIGEKLINFLPKNYHIEATEISEYMCRISRNRNYSNSNFYHKISCCDIFADNEFTSNGFNLIISYLSLDIYRDLSIPLKKLRNKFPHAKIALCLRESSNKETELDKIRFNFLYDTEIIKKEINKANYKIISIKKFHFYNSEKYCMLICTNQTN